MVINPLVGVYIPIIRIPIKGGMTISNIATFDHGTVALNWFWKRDALVSEKVGDPKNPRKGPGPMEG